MKFFAIFITCFILKVSYAEDLHVISAKDAANHNSEEVSKPTVVVDIFGNTEWKYPSGYFNEKKPVIKSKAQSSPSLVKKEVIRRTIKAYKPFIKGNNTLHSFFIYGAGIGSLQGVSGGYSYSSNYLSHNLEGRSYTNQNYQSDLQKNFMMFNYKLEYHAFPIWYVTNSSFPVFDAGFSLSFGRVSIEESTGLIEDGLFWAAGGFLKYPISTHIKIKANIEIINGLGTKTNGNFGSATSLGLTLDL